MVSPSGEFLNDTEDDCCIAAAAHACQVMFGAEPTDAEVQAAFTAWCDPTGCDVEAVLKEFQSVGLAGYKLGSYAIAANDAEHIAGLAAAGCSYVSFDRFETVTNHCVLGLALDAVSFTCFSWGQVHVIPIADYHAGVRTAYTLSDKPAPVSVKVWAYAAVAAVLAAVVLHLAGVF